MYGPPPESVLAAAPVALSGRKIPPTFRVAAKAAAAASPRRRSCEFFVEKEKADVPMVESSEDEREAEVPSPVEETQPGGFEDIQPEIQPGGLDAESQIADEDRSVLLEDCGFLLATLHFDFETTFMTPPAKFRFSVKLKFRNSDTLCFGTSQDCQATPVLLSVGQAKTGIIPCEDDPLLSMFHDGL